MPSILSRVAGFLFALLVFAAPVRSLAQVSIADLPPVDSVFRLSADAVSGDEVALNWQISKGFYLYRHSLKLTSVSGLSNASLDIPPGKKAHDEFFGDVETYRDRLRVGILGSNAGPTAEFTIRYQGCADVGVCYPPQTRTLRVPLPVAAAGPTNLFGKPIAAPDQALPADRAFQITATPVGADRLRISLVAVDGYYLYQRQIRVTSHTPSVVLGKPSWPTARMFDDPEFGRVPVYFGAHDLDIPLHRTSTAAGPLKLTVAYQGCKENGICYTPMSQSFTVSLPAAAAVSTIPQAVTNVTTGNKTQPLNTVTPPGAETAPEVLATAAVKPVDPTVATPRTPPPAAPPAKSSISMGLALLMALLGGLILNLMPCVLPVLSLKALSIAQHGGGDARKHALAYTVGVMASFLALGGLLLALRGAGDSVGWAFQMQQPLVITALALLIFALGLSLSGVWYAGGKWLGFGQSLTTGSTWRSDFFTGLLAVVVATPCVAPFMGAAMAWAFFAPTLGALLVFLALGLGLALPFLLIGFFPSIARILPKPGPWMETFKQFMAFPMYLTSIWLVWVLAQQRGSTAAAWCLVAALLIAFAAWAWTRANRVDSRALKVLALAALIAVAWPVLSIARTPLISASATAPVTGEHIPFDASRIAALRAAGQPVFVNITADWCISCKVNERAVLSKPDFRSLLTSTRTVYMVGDYTNVDDSLTAYLQSFNAVGVPLYVYYPAGSGDPVVLPTILTPATVRNALTK